VQPMGVQVQRRGSEHGRVDRDVDARRSV
jgi:hypothetical protein